MVIETIAVLSPGDMGHGVGGAIHDHGLRVITSLEGRGALSRQHAADAGMEDVGGIEDVVATADLILSILPPERASDLGGAVADAMMSTGKTPVFADCNAVSPDTVRGTAEKIIAAGGAFIDIGILGPPPHSGEPRLYASGENLDVLDVIDGARMKIVKIGPEVGRASAVKMCYASMTKGTLVLRTAMVTLAEILGVSEEIHSELESSQKDAWKSINSMIPWYSMNAARYVGEMEEIAMTYESAGLTPDFHKGAAAMYRLLASTPLADESRETRDMSRTVKQAVEIYAAAAGAKQAAE